jgi:branched-chain amino acid transport system ATP-binding protein
MLEIKNIDAFYGKTQALYDVSIKVNEAEIVALIGSNGAGKTTTLNVISGLLRPSSGSIEYMGKPITGLKTFSIVEQGICHIPEGRRPFPDMSVRENLEMGAYLPRVWKNREQALEQIFEFFPVLRKKEDLPASALSGGEQQMLVMGRESRGAGGGTPRWAETDLNRCDYLRPDAEGVASNLIISQDRLFTITGWHFLVPKPAAKSLYKKR